MDDANHIKCACPTCGKKFSLALLQYAGKKARCPQCQSVFTVPGRNDNQPDAISSAETNVNPPEPSADGRSAGSAPLSPDRIPEETEQLAGVTEPEDTPQPTSLHEGIEKAVNSFRDKTRRLLGFLTSASQNTSHDEGSASNQPETSQGPPITADDSGTGGGSSIPKTQKEKMMLAAIIAEGGVILCLVIVLIIVAATGGSSDSQSVSNTQAPFSSAVPKIDVAELVNSFDKYASKEIEMEIIIVEGAWDVNGNGDMTVSSLGNPNLSIQFSVKMKRPGNGGKIYRNVRARITVRIPDHHDSNTMFWGEVEDLTFL